MRQYNHWKTKELTKLSIRFSLIVFIAISLVACLLFKMPISVNLFSNIASVVIALLFLIIFLLEKYLWKTKFMRLPFINNYWTPVIEGRWKGKLVREGEKHEFVIEIKQDFSSVSCTTYSKHSSSSSYATEILYDDNSKTYQLIYYWRAKTTNTQYNTGESNIFDGFTVLDIIIENSNAKRLKGSYFTDRQPSQTRGTLNLDFEQKMLKNSFD